MLQIQVTAAHIAAAKPYPFSSPLALALQEMGFADASVTHHYAYFGNNAYPLPSIATEREISYDFFMKCSSSQGKALEQIKPYSFELHDG